jgi:hypothetical protein
MEAGYTDSPEQVVQSLLFRDLFTRHGDPVGGGIIMMAALEVFRVRAAVVGVGCVGPGKAQGLEQQYFQPVFVVLLTTGSGELFQAGCRSHSGKGLPRAGTIRLPNQVKGAVNSCFWPGLFCFFL